jgi:3-oxoacyl-[acyl-carrier-protein] synthase-3
MDGRHVFKMATTHMMEVAQEVLKRNGVSVSDLSLVLMHQANLRINEFVQKTLGLRDEQVHNNIQKYGNTTAATIPLCLEEAIAVGKVKPGDLVCAVAFGAGFTWGSLLMRW